MLLTTTLCLQLLLLLQSTYAFTAPSVSSRLSTTKSSSSIYSSSNDEEFTGFGNVGFLVLAGGTGSRMKANMPKQFLTLSGSPVLHYSLHLFLEKLPEYCAQNGLSPPSTVVLVMDPKYQPEYQPGYLRRILSTCGSP